MRFVVCEFSKRECANFYYKVYNYGFTSGRSGYCRMCKKWTHDVKVCPKAIESVAKGGIINR